jgi:hypothetical protein
VDGHHVGTIRSNILHIAALLGGLGGRRIVWFVTRLIFKVRIVVAGICVELLASQALVRMFPAAWKTIIVTAEL